MRVLWTLGHPKPRNVKLFRVHWGQTEAYFIRFLQWRILGFGAQNLYLSVYSCLKPIIFIHSEAVAKKVSRGGQNTLYLNESQKISISCIFLWTGFAKDIHIVCSTKKQGHGCFVSPI
jgi:hypothetical protein